MGDCLLCKLDAHDCPEDDRRIAYHLLGRVHEEGDAVDEDMCGLHTMTFVTALAVLADLTGNEGTAKDIRRIRNVRAVPDLPNGGPADGA